MHVARGGRGVVLGKDGLDSPDELRPRRSFPHGRGVERAYHQRSPEGAGIRSTACESATHIWIGRILYLGS